MKKEKAIVFAVSKDLAFSVACVLIDIKRLMPNLNAEIVVIHDGIKKGDKTLLSMILPVRFIEYKMPYDDLTFIPKRIINYFTKMVFAKFECLKLLNEYKTVMLSDYDIVIRDDISELFEWCESGVKMLRGGVKVAEQFHSPIDGYDMERECVAAGLFVFQEHMGDYNSMHSYCYSSLKKYAPALYMPEQAIFDLMIQDYNLSICTLETSVYALHPSEVANVADAKIIHAYGQPKFWNGLVHEQWTENYSIWLKMGGSKYKKTYFKYFKW